MATVYKLNVATISKFIYCLLISGVKTLSRVRSENTAREMFFFFCQENSFFKRQIIFRKNNLNFSVAFILFLQILENFNYLKLIWDCICLNYGLTLLHHNFFNFSPFIIYDSGFRKQKKLIYSKQKKNVYHPSQRQIITVLIKSPPLH